MSHRERATREQEGRALAADEIGAGSLYAAGPWAAAGATGPQAALNHLAQSAIRQPLSCFVDLLNNQARCNQPVDRAALARAWATYKEKSNWTPLPVRKIAGTVTQGAEMAGGLIILFTYLPIFIIAFFAIWGLVGLHLMRWGMGLALTFLLVFFLYIMTVVYRSAIQSWLASKTNQFLVALGKAEVAALEHVLKSPQAIMAAVCEYTGCPWQCQPGTTGGQGQSCRNGM